MATTIMPSFGAAGPLYTQLGVGSTTGYGAVDERRASSAGLFQEGVIDSGSYAVTQRAAGVNMSVDVAASTGAGAWVKGDSVSQQGLYLVPPHNTGVNEAIAAAHATNPRIDRVVLQVRDESHDASGANDARVVVITGTATGSATLTNLAGAATVPNGCLLLADVLVPAAATTILSTNIRDRRTWARGAFCVSSVAASKTTTSTSFVLADSANLNPRIECSGVPVRVSLHCSWLAAGTGKSIILDVFTDGLTSNLQCDDTTAATNKDQAFDVGWTFTPSAGSHKIGLAFASLDGTNVQLSGNSNGPIIWTIEEIVRQNTANTATSG